MGFHHPNASDFRFQKLLSLLSCSIAGKTYFSLFSSMVGASVFSRVLEDFARKILSPLLSSSLLSNVKILLRFIKIYENSSGQKVNTAKTIFIAPKKTSRSKARRLSAISGFSQGFFLTTYLGVPISKGKISRPMLQQLVQKITIMIEGWKAKLLNPAARLVLIKHVLSSIPIHLLSAINIPKSIIRSIDSSIVNFFWGSLAHGNKHHWISWEKICAPQQEGGLGIMRIEEVMRALRIKMAWNLLKGSSLWAGLFSAKYLWKFLSNHGRLGVVIFPSWKEIARVLPFTLKHSKWLLGMGNVSFWFHNWSSNGILAGAVVTIIPRHLLYATVSDFNPISGCMQLADVQDIITPSAMAVPIDTAIQRFGVSLASKCECYRNRQSADPMQFASNLADRCRSQPQFAATLHSISVLPRPLFPPNHLSGTAVPIGQGAEESIAHLFYQGQTASRKLPFSTLSTSPMGWLKLNIDGSSRGNPGESGGGGVCRDHSSNLIFAFHRYYSTASNTITETQAMLDGLNICSYLGLTNIIVESDSKLIVEAMDDLLSSIPWKF
ncbi:uncharacterized protein LOC131224226 [Magnolia sinica]|uniref:uncharacterized protein LOC131224226 n=1 Tax=Magnolia sinica TaxID=86752 RepID=UPI00265888F5|nr:uncharacterized protein LOC131224226 [Magnolia sinica]